MVVKIKMRKILSYSAKLFTGTFKMCDKSNNEKGSAIIIALFVMVLLLGFVAFAIIRTNNETVSASNDAAETRTFEAAQASLEVMTRNFDKIFDVKINVSTADETRIAGQIPPEFDDYNFVQTITQRQPNQQVVMTGTQYQGLNASRDEWLLDATAKEKGSGVEVQLRRSFYNNRIPIFQFGIFYDDDLEFHPGPRFDFGGRVHSNASLFLKSGNVLNFSSKVTTHKEIYTDVMRNGNSTTTNGVNIKNAAGNYVELKYNMGSALQSPVNGAPVSTDPDMPVAYKNANWAANESLFQGNVLSNQKTLDLPIRLESNINNTTVDYVELIKRGQDLKTLWNDKTSGSATSPNIVPVTTATKDSDITSRQRYYNGTGIRVTLADRKERLPGCASGTGTNAVTGACGIRLDGDITGAGADPTGTETVPGSSSWSVPKSRGYEPTAMVGGTYKATRVNGERFYINDLKNPKKQTWIKVETVSYDAANNLTVTADITEDFLSLGVTEAAPQVGNDFNIQNPANYYSSAIDSRSIIKLQRFAIVGSATANLPTNTYLTSGTYGVKGYNYVIPAEHPNTGNLSASNPINNGTFASFTGAGVTLSSPTRNFSDNPMHWREAKIANDDSKKQYVVPFPINMFDSREGTYCNGCLNPDGTVFNPINPLSANKWSYHTNVPWMGVMSMVDIDVKNLKRFLDGEFDGKFPKGLTSSQIPSLNGWILYISDRRGDFDFDGEFDMEDIYGNNDCTLQTGEDVNTSGVLDIGGLCLGTTLNPFGINVTEEAPTYFKSGLATAASTDPWRTSFVSPQIAAVLEHKFYRRGVRLINGEKVPGYYDSANPGNTKGFTVASENGLYVQGNYNATGISSIGSPTAAANYLPQNTTDHIPASIAADAITILSNKWNDGQSFITPFSAGSRAPVETTVRFAMIAGDARTSKKDDPSQSPFNEPRMGGGVHNFKRFLENWAGTRLNYSGSIINLYNARNNNGTYKTGFVYNAPNRNWVFDDSFLNPDRLPPGTPFFQFIQLTGFQRVN